MDIIKYMKHLDSCLMERIEDFENLGQSPKCDCGLEEAIQQVKLFATPDVSGQVCGCTNSKFHSITYTYSVCQNCNKTRYPQTLR